jgi:hypothetical protein
VEHFECLPDACYPHSQFKLLLRTEDFFPKCKGNSQICPPVRANRIRARCQSLAREIIEPNFVSGCNILVRVNRCDAFEGAPSAETER